MACPGEEQLLAFLDGALGEAELAAVDAHLGGCAACARVYALAIDGAFARGDAGAPAGGRVGRYVLQAPLGAGAMGVVYAAFDPELGRPVALKLLHAGGDDAAASARLLREAQAMARLSHPNVVAVYDAGTWNGRVFIAMELVEGGTLAGFCRERPRGWREVVAVFRHAGAGLAAAHAAGLVHRDFKPENVLMGGGRVRVTDFGLARVGGEFPSGDGTVEGGAAATPLTRTGTLLGSPAYMAPEQLRGERADARADVFAFCVALFECLAGERPFAGESVAELRAAIEAGRAREIASDRRVPAFVRRVLARGLHASPDRRYQSMDELLRDLAREPRRALRWSLAGGALALAAVGVALAQRPRAWRPHVVDLPAYEENAEAPVLSPDGKLMAYPSDRGDRARWQLFVEPLDGGEARALTPPGPRPHCPRFSRDGQSVLYVDDGSSEARRVPIAGGPSQLVARGVQCLDDCGPAGLLLQRGGAPDCPFCERLVLQAGGREREVARLAGRHIRPVRCDRDGRRFTFATGGAGLREIFVGTIGAAGGDLRALASSSDALADPAFSPDGQSVLYGAEVGGRMNVFEQPLAGGEPRRVTDGQGPDVGPDPSRDGRALAWQVDTTPRLLFRIDLATGRASRVSARLQEFKSACFTLDGKSVLAQVLRGGRAQLAVLPFDGGAERLLAAGETPDLTLDDGEIVFSGEVAPGRFRVLALPFEGGAARTIAEGDGVVHDLLVGVDGRVHLRVDRGEGRAALSAPLAGGPLEPDAPEPWSMIVPMAGGVRVALRAIGFYDEVWLVPPGARLDAGLPGAGATRLPARLFTLTRDRRAIVYGDGLRIVRRDLATSAEALLYTYALPFDFELSPDGKTLLLGEFVGAVHRHLITNFADRPR